MRRFLAYSIISGAFVVAAACCFSPIVTGMNADVAYADGITMTFRASNGGGEDSYDYYNPSDEAASPFSQENGNQATDIEEVADVFRARLENWDLTEYSVTTVGYDTIEATFLPTHRDQTEFERLQRYLSFSGGDLSLNVNNQNYGNPEFSSEGLDTMLDGVTAFIEYIDNSQGSSYPVVLMDLAESDRTYLVNDAETGIVNYCVGNHTEDDPSTEDTDESASVDLIVWGNMKDTVDYSNGVLVLDNVNTDNRIIYQSAVSAIGDAVYYYDTDDDQEHPYFMMVPSTIESSDPSEPYREALFIRNMVNASEFTLKNGSSFKVDFLYSNTASATVENLVSYDAWNRVVSMSRTFIGFIVAYLLSMIILALFLRGSAIGAFGTTTLSLFTTLGLFTLTGAQFSIGTLMALAVIALLSVFGQIVYHSKLKDEIYKGRNLKKANQEAGKRAFLPTLDAGIITLIIGLFMYILAPGIVQTIGVTLIIGAAFATLYNLVVYRFLMWEMCNDDSMQGKPDKLLGLDKNKIPDLLKEEKQTQFGTFQDKDFTKAKKWLAGFFGAVAVAGIVTMSIFGALNGTVYNDTTSNAESTVIMVESRTSAYATSGSASANDSPITSVDDIYSSSTSTGTDTTLLSNVYYLEDPLTNLWNNDETAIADSIVSGDSYKEVYDDDHETYYAWYFYKISLPSFISLDEMQEGSFMVKNYDDTFDSYSSFNEALSGYIEIYHSGSITGDVSLRIIADTAKGSEGTPNLSSVALGLGVGIAVAMVYMMLRYRPSRGLQAGILSFVSGFMALSFFVFTRISVTPVVAVGSAGVCIVSLLLSLFILSSEKEVVKETHDRTRSNLEIRSEAIAKANSYAAADVILLTLFAAYIAICFFAFGPSSYASAWLNLVLGLAFAIGANLVLLAPASVRVAKLLSKIKIKPRKKKKQTVGQLSRKKGRSAEPEEAIFIGIND